MFLGMGSVLCEKRDRSLSVFDQSDCVYLNVCTLLVSLTNQCLMVVAIETTDSDV